MDRDDNIRELAEKVMGWTPAGGSIYTDQNGRAKWIYCSTGTTRGGWNPFTDANAALKVVEATIKKTGYRILVGNDGESYCAMFRDEAGGFRDFDGEGTFCEAVCTAALAAIRSK